MSEKSKKRGGTRAGAGRKPKSAKASVAPENTPTSDTRWKPGQSGNPGGRPAVVKEIRELARANTATAFETLLLCCKSEDAPWAARVAAASHIIDRGFGKPMQNIRATVRRPGEMSDDELIGFLSGDDEAAGGEGIAAPEGDPPVTH